MHIGFVVADFLQYSTQQDNDKLPLTETHSSWFHSNTDWLDSSWIPVESNTGPAQAATAPATAAANATDCSVYPDESSHLPSRLGSDFDESDDANCPVTGSYWGVSTHSSALSEVTQEE